MQQRHARTQSAWNELKLKCVCVCRAFPFVRSSDSALLVDFQHDTHIYFANAPNEPNEYKVRKIVDCEIDVSNVVFRAFVLSRFTLLYLFLYFFAVALQWMLLYVCSMLDKVYSKLWEIRAAIFVSKCSFPCTRLLTRPGIHAYTYTTSRALFFWSDFSYFFFKRKADATEQFSVVVVA